jgi:hypothetical protein
MILLTEPAALEERKSRAEYLVAQLCRQVLGAELMHQLIQLMRFKAAAVAVAGMAVALVCTQAVVVAADQGTSVE